MKHLVILLTSILVWTSCETPSNAPTEEIATAQRAFVKNKTKESGLALIQSYLDHVNKQKDSQKHRSENAMLIAKAADVAGEIDVKNQRAILQHIYVRDFFDQPETPRMIYELSESFAQNGNEMAAVALAKGLNSSFPESQYATKSAERANSIEDDLQTMLNKMAINIFRKENPGTRKDIAASYVNVSEAYALSMPDDKDVPLILHQAAEISRSLQDMGKSLNIYDWLLSKYPQDSLRANALFFKAQILDDHLGKEEEARVYYEQFIEEYPEHPFAKDAQFLIEMLGKSDEEIFEEIRKKASQKKK